MYDLIGTYKTVVTTLKYWRRARDSNPQVRKDAGFQVTLYQFVLVCVS